MSMREAGGGTDRARKFLGFSFTVSRHHGTIAQIRWRFQAENPGDHAKGQGVALNDDNGRAGHVYAGRAAADVGFCENARGVDSLSIDGSGYDCGPLFGANGTHQDVAGAAIHRTESRGRSRNTAVAAWTLAYSRSKALSCAISHNANLKSLGFLPRSLTKHVSVNSRPAAIRTRTYVVWDLRRARLPPIPILASKSQVKMDQNAGVSVRVTTTPPRCIERWRKGSPQVLS